MSVRTEDAVQRIRVLADRGLQEEDLIEHVASSLGRELSPLTFIAVLGEAFGIPLMVLRDRAEGWIGLDQPGCTTSTGEVAAVLRDYIRENDVDERKKW